MKEHKAAAGGEAKSVRFIWFGVVFSILYWLLEAFRDVFVFSRGTIASRVFAPDSMAIWMRLMVVFIILLFSARTQAISNRIRDHAEKGKKAVSMLGIIRVGMEFGLLYWILESLRDAFVFGKGGFFERLISPEPMGFWMRLLAVFILMLFSLYAQSIFNAQVQAQEVLKRKKEELEMEVQRQSQEVNKVQFILEKERKEKQQIEEELLKTREALNQRTVSPKSKVRIDALKNRVYVTLAGVMNREEVVELKENYIQALHKMRRGFDVLVDAKELKPCSSDVQRVFEEITRLESRLGLTRIARVEGVTPLGAMQLDRISRTVSKTPGMHFKSLVEAESFLDQARNA